MSLFSKKNEGEKAAPPKKLALVLSGGGPRGALQVGALRVLIEAGIVPDMIVGTSIGAINGSYLARYGYNLDTLAHLNEVWNSASKGSFAPADFLLSKLRNLLPGNKGGSFFEQARAFHAERGIHPELRFGDLSGPRLFIVTADISHHKLAIFGENQDDLVLPAMLASSSIPPWMPPSPIASGLHLDGGATSNVPIEPAMRLGATEMIVLDLFHPSEPIDEVPGFAALLDRVFTVMQARHLELELELARLHNIPVHLWPLRYKTIVPTWDFSHTRTMMSTGYEQGQRFLAEMRRRQAQEAAVASPTTESLLAQWRAKVNEWLGDRQ